MPIYFGSQLISELRVGTQLYDGYAGSQMVHGKHSLPAFTYDGTWEEHPASYYGLSGDYTVVALLTSGTLRFANATRADVFMVGGGGGGSKGNYTRAGGGGGYTTTIRDVEITEAIAVTVGAGGVASGTTGGNGDATYFGDYHVNGGEGANQAYGGDGGSGGASGSNSDANGANGGSDGSDGGFIATPRGGVGQGTTTSAFAEPSATLFAGGGASGSKQSTPALGGVGGGGNGAYFIDILHYEDAENGTANTGGGGGGSFTTRSNAGSGGSGIVLMRPPQ